MSRITTVLYDLDGTLLPMDQDEFTKGYFKLLAAKLAPYGYEAKKLIDSIWAGTAEMVKNDGGRTNEEAFWKKFAEIYGEAALADKPILEEFYNVDFKAAERFCGKDPKAPQTVRVIKEHGLRTALATNPIFPETATWTRIGWAGLSPDDFELITTYENSRYSKPNPYYYTDIAKRLGVDPAECLMVGNDVGEDMLAAGKAGMSVFLITNCMINKTGVDVGTFPHGDFDDLEKFAEKELFRS